jgi:2-polyprenyl-6-methoxyphenol hydroxylase-like FAD-dependent oxidoreductase
MRSAVRGLVDGAAPAPEYCGIVGTGGVAPDPGIDCEPGVFTMVFGRNGFFGYSRNPADDGIWWFVNLPWRREPSVAELSAIGDEVWQRRLVELFSADDSPAVRVIEAAPARYEWSVMHQMAAPRRWFRERMVLIGDAAHVTSPSSGQGAGMAIEDAVELARCLRDFPETESAFLAYQRLRESRVKKVHDGARRINRSKSATGMARVVRDALFPVMMKKFGKPGSFDWLYEHRIDFDARVDPALGVR